MFGGLERAIRGVVMASTVLAPGVWTPLTAGVDVHVAVTSGVADGLCDSIVAYVRTYRATEAFHGSCW